jgi:hypothetical protein
MIGHAADTSDRTVLVTRRAEIYRIQSSSFRTGVKEIVTLLGKSRRSISSTMAVHVTRDMDSVSLAFERFL